MYFIFGIYFTISMCVIAILMQNEWKLPLVVDQEEAEMFQRFRMVFYFFYAMFWFPIMIVQLAKKR